MSESPSPTYRAQFVTTDVAARLLATPKDTIVQWCRTGRLPAIRPGRAWLIPADVIAELRRQADADAATRRQAGAA